MIGASPVSCLVPLDYRYALDGAVTLLAGLEPPTVYCDVAPLLVEAEQRFPRRASSTSRSPALWIEPLVPTWRSDLDVIADALTVDGLLVVIASRPLARLLPERQGWRGDPIGLRPLGITQVMGALGAGGFRLIASYGVHSLPAIVRSLLGQVCDCAGHAERGDRWRVAARSAYHASGTLAPLSTVALLVARKGRL